jgi:hypothetical protein
MKMKKLQKIITGTILMSLLIGLFCSPVTVKANYLGWWDEAIEIPLGDAQHIDSDGYDSEEYFYFYVPATLSVNLNYVSDNTKQPYEIILYDSNADCEYYIGKRDDIWKKNPKTRKISMNKKTTLKKGYYYIDIYDAGTGYTLKLSASLTNKITLSSVKKKSKTSAKITWKKTSSITGYQIYRSTSKNGTYKKIKTVSNKTASMTNTGLKKGKNYWYKVRAYKKIGKKTYYSSFSSKKSVKL